MPMPSINMSGYYQQLLSVGSAMQSAPRNFMNLWNMATPTMLNPVVYGGTGIGHEIASTYNMAFSTPPSSVHQPYMNMSTDMGIHITQPPNLAGMNLGINFVQPQGFGDITTSSRFNTNQNYDDYYFSDGEYNEALGEDLAEIAYYQAKRMDQDSKTGQCAKGVRQALERAGISDGSIHASAYMWANDLATSPYFEEVAIDKSDLPDLPPGAIVVWGRTRSKPHGHISVALGDGREASDHVQNQITDPSNKYSSCRVFLPT